MNNPISDVLNSIEKLEFVGKISKDITVTDDIVVTLTTLNAEDDIQTHMNCEGLSGSAYIDRNKVEVLCFAITKINNASLNPKDYLGKVELGKGKDNENITDIKEYIYNRVKENVQKWTKTVIDTLFLHYIAMLSEVEKNAENIKFIEPIEKKEENISKNIVDEKKESDSEKHIHGEDESKNTDLNKESEVGKI